MKTKMRLLATVTVVLVFCLAQFGCSFVLMEGDALKNPTEAIVSTTTEAGGESLDSPSDTPDATTGTSGSQMGTVTTGSGQTTTKAPIGGKVTTSRNTTTQAAIKNVEKPLSGKLEIQISTNESQVQADMWTSLIDMFEQKTGVNVTAYIGSQVNTQLAKRWIGGNPPDIACLSGAGIPDIALEESGALYDCTDMLKNGYVYGTDEKIWDVVHHDLHEISSGNRYFRPGYLAASYGVLYDKTYINELGEKMPSNYTELMAFADRVIAKGKTPFTTYGSTGGYSTWSMVMPAIAAYGQTTLDKVLQVNVATWKGAEVRSVLQRWYDFCDKKGALMTGTATFDHTTAQMKWLKHDAVLIGNGIWLPWEVQNNTPKNFEMAYTHSPMILANQSPSVVLYPTSMIIAKDGKNLENAKAFMRFLYTKEAQSILVRGIGYFGGRNDMDYTRLDGLSAASRRILTYIYSDAVKRTYRRYSWGDLNDTINGSVHGLMTGSLTVDQAVSRVVSKAH
ncbi:MAG: extracellular solute-binding protein [Clostridia bacterium]|nr:extracellular solute-binding protein [Clostridia bacterium]